MNALGYVRRSSKSDEKTVSLATQTEAIRSYAKEAGLELVALLEDDGVVLAQAEAGQLVAIVRGHVQEVRRRDGLLAAGRSR